MNRFENKVVVITGAAGGIGEATTRRVVSEGGKVVIADHSEKRAEQLANELTHAGADVRHVYFSATELQSCKELIDFSMNEYQRIDVLINNVGGTDPKRDLNIEKLDINYFDEAFHLNLCCTMYLSQQVIPIMTTNGGGNIVNVASIYLKNMLKRLRTIMVFVTYQHLNGNKRLTNSKPTKKRNAAKHYKLWI